MKNKRFIISIVVCLIFICIIIFGFIGKKYDIDGDDVKEAKVIKLTQGDNVEKNDDGELIKKGDENNICFT